MYDRILKILKKNIYNQTYEDNFDFETLRILILD